MKTLLLSLSLFAFTLLSGPAAAGPPAEGKRGKNAAEVPRRLDARLAGENRPSAQDMAKRMMEQFDKDGDSKLDSTELVAALTFVQQRMSGRRGGGRPDARGGEARKRAQRGGEANQAAGGDRPRRPAAE